MNHPTSNEQDNASEPTGARGPSGILEPTTANNRLINRAIRGGWAVPKQLKRLVIAEYTKQLESGQLDGKEAAAIGNSVIAMTNHNQRGQLKALDKQSPDQIEVNHTLGIADAVRQRLDEMNSANDPTRADPANEADRPDGASDEFASVLGDESFAREVAPGPTLIMHRSSSNGPNRKED